MRRGASRIRSKAPHSRGLELKGRPRTGRTARGREEASEGDARTRAFISIWREYLAEGAPLPQLDRWLSRRFREDRRHGKRDRSWLSDICFAAARYGELLVVLQGAARAIAKGRFAGDGAAAFERALAALPEDGAPPLEAWRGIINAELLFFLSERMGLPTPPGARKECGEAFRAARGLATAGKGPEGLRLVWNGLPAWAGPELAERARVSGWTEADVAAFLRRHSERPPLWIRLNSPTRREEVLAELAAEGFAVEPAPGVDGAFGVRGEKSLFELKCFRGGAFEIQDLASQRIGLSVDLRPGQFAWDCCAGSGGKTLLLSARSGGKGAIYASDSREHALEDARLRVRRAGFQNVRFVPWDGETLPPFGKEVSFRGGFDWVLVDAPCSGSGTWRRNPDAKYRFHPGTLGELLDLQAKLLRSAARAVKPGGGLVYGTCSFLVAENERVVEAFVASSPEFSLERAAVHGNPLEDGDTTFTAVLRRRQ